jgi:flagellin
VAAAQDDSNHWESALAIRKSSIDKEKPMSLGVLNNLNAIYATNNLNNTNASLSKTLQQLSSGSRINSGADDAAGLSLVNGLAANSAALTQSSTNATEGVGLLQVADGALSQVTNLLNRAVTLATEVSNGTLNGSQQTAANQEYQSILSEVNNIGSTTTYNQQKVFGGADVSIYTGDSSTQSASIDLLHFATVSSASVGDAGGAMNYSAGQSVFVDLSKGGTSEASGGDAVTAGSTLTVNYKNADGSSGSKTIATGGTTGFADTVNGMISAINSSGLGLSASLTTAKAAGSANPAADVGIQITGEIGTIAPARPMMQAVAGTLKDTNSGETAAADVSAGTAGIAMISYNAANDTTANLTTNDLSSQSNAQSALTVLNSAITAVAGQDGYIGAQINTLQAVSQVVSTQQQNIVAAQNAVQATDYAQASSNLSKYEILSQTGISALAQANSLQQEVTKLLQ